MLVPFMGTEVTRLLDWEQQQQRHDWKLKKKHNTTVNMFIYEDYVKLIYLFSISSKVDSATFSLVCMLCELCLN